MLAIIGTVFLTVGLSSAAVAGEITGNGKWISFYKVRPAIHEDSIHTMIARIDHDPDRRSSRQVRRVSAGSGYGCIAADAYVRYLLNQTIVRHFLNIVGGI